ncbi:MAG: molybdate ABC transporter substrate-binding protein [Terrimicrobiaceae bacterium]
MNCARALLLALALATAGSAAGGELSVAAASDLRYALDACIAKYRAEHPDAEIKPVYGSSGNFFAQISNGAPFDLFLSADRKYPDKLVAEGRATAGSLFVYAIGRLVLWVPNDSPIDVENLGMAALKAPSARRIAIANPAHAPYGQAAVAAMSSSGIYEGVRDRLVLGDNIAQTAQFLESGAADIGLIALSLALSDAMRTKGRYQEVPQSAYPEMLQAGVITGTAANPGAAARFSAFLTSAAGRETLKAFGFAIPGETSALVSQ